MTELAAIAADIWARLGASAERGRLAWHTPVVGTADGALRVMVLRHVDPVAATLHFHTDARAPKVAVIEADARVALLFYDPEAKLQLRCTGRGAIAAAGALADAAWTASPASSRRCYLAQAAPGSRTAGPSSGLPHTVEGRVPTLAETEPGRAHFAVLTVTLDSIDWLYLAHDGHRRALFERRDDGWTMGWRIP